VLDATLATILVGLPLLALLVLAAGAGAYRGMIRYRVRDPAWIEATSLESGSLRPEQLDYPWLRERVASPFGYELAVYALPGRARKVAIFHHGISWCWLGMVRYMEILKAEGWTVVALDSRGHGESGGGRPSYGFYEKADLKAVANWALASFPHDEGYVAFGISMGAATVLQYAPTDPRLDAAVADSSFRSAVAELDHRLKRGFVPFFLRPLVIRVADAICRRREGFSLYGIRPEDSILETDIPLMLIHGLADDYVPWKMSLAMAETRRRRLPEAVTELRLVPEGEHARSIKADPEGYAAALLDFVAQNARSPL
jgi:alpha-beta hydrolase superfamily lysophospholipase